MRTLKTFFFVLVGIFAVIGAATAAVFFGMKLGLFNVRGSIAERNAFFLNSASAIGAIEPLAAHAASCADDATEECAWQASAEWQTVRGGLEKDAAVIRRVSIETGVPARLIAATVVPEQLRFFGANREIFKRYFEPLKILGAMSEFSLGVSGIKMETAREIERHATDPTSPFYPGDDTAKLRIGDTDETEIFARLTDSKDHYWQYLYTALYIREIEAQWSHAGYDISARPDAMITLFNIGFGKSKPHGTPQAGGAPVAVGGREYAYGRLGQLFYESAELRDIFE